MERFELLDILSQDKHGIVYVAWDSVLAQKVTIRRFLPFGPNGGGLETDEAAVFESAADRISALKHKSLRSVMFGGVDPIDSIPYLVNEWVEGVSLKSLLAEEQMEPELVIDVLRIALETSVVLSQVLGEDAVWVETEASAIFVGADETERGFTFWISPFKWLGGEQQSRKLSSIVELGEELAGWKKKLVSDNAGYGLGGWLKWLKRNPDVSLKEALESLASSTGQALPPAVEEPVVVQQTLRPSAPKLNHASSKTPITIAVVLAVLVMIAALIFFTKKASSETASDPAESQKPATKVSAPPTKAPTPAMGAPLPVSDATARVNALAEKLQREAEERSNLASEKLAQKAADIAAQVALVESRGGYHSPDQSELVRTYKMGAPIKLKGVLLGVRASDTGKSIYLNFSDPVDQNLTNVVLKEVDFKDNYSVEEFQKFIGKSVTINGNVFTESTKAYYVKITSLDQISLEE